MLILLPALIAAASLNLSGQDSLDRVVSQINNNSGGVILYIRGKADLSKINAAVDDKRLLGWNPLILDFDGTPDNLVRASLELSWSDSFTWAFYYKGGMIASGAGQPTAAEIKAAFERAGVPNKIVSLKSFLAFNPNNLDARLALMGELFGRARQKTSKALNIAQKDPMSNLTLGKTTPPDIKEKLTSDADENIWGELASLISNSFNSGEWLSILPDYYFSRGRSQESMALYSPIMTTIYKKNISRVEDELKRRPVDFGLWSMWLEFAQAANRRISDFFPQIPPPPKESNHKWPPIQVTGWITKEAMANNDWSKVIEYMWPNWGGLQLSLSLFAPVNGQPASNSKLLSSQKDFFWKEQILPLFEACLQNKDFDKANEIYFDISSRPVFEREAKLAFEMAKAHKHIFPANFQPETPAPEGEIQSFLGDPIAGNTLTFKPKLNRLKDICHSGYLNLLVIDPFENNHFGNSFPQANPLEDNTPQTNPAENNPPEANQLSVSVSGTNALDNNPPETTQAEGIPTQSNQTETQPETSPPAISPSELLKRHTDSLVLQGKLPEYSIVSAVMPPDNPIAVELINREGLSDKALIWGLLDEDAKYYHGGNSIPTLDDVMDVLSGMNIKTHMEIFREFVKNNPESVTAKTVLLGELARIGNIRTPGAEMDADNLLTASADLEIWGEFVNAANASFSQIILRPEIMFMVTFKLPFIKNSRLLQQFAARNIALVENALRQQPHSKNLWEFWGMFSPYLPNRSLPSFMASLTPVPGLTGFPPAFLYPVLIESYKSMDAWAQTIKLLEPVWESYQNMVDEGEDIKHRLTKNLWEQYVQPLCEAYDKTGQTQKAEKIMSVWFQSGGWRVS